MRNADLKRENVLAAYRKDPGATLREFCKMTGINSTAHVRHYLMQLTNEGVINWIPRPVGNPGLGRGDHRLNDSEETREKKAAAARKSRKRGAEMLVAGRDDELEKRIRKIERREKRRLKKGATRDVVNGDHVIRLNGLRASRVG